MAFGDGVNFIDFSTDNDFGGDPSGIALGADAAPEQGQGLGWEEQSGWQKQGGIPLNSYGMSQSQLAKLWSDLGADAPTYAGAYDGMGQMSSMNRILNNDWMATQGANGQYGLTPKLNHGWNAEFVSMIARMLPAIGAIAGAGSGAAGAAGAGADAGSAYDLGSLGDISANELAGQGFNLGPGFEGVAPGVYNFGTGVPMELGTYSPGTFNEAGYTGETNPDMASGGGIGGGSQGTSVFGDKSKEQRGVISSGLNAIQPGAGNVYSMGDKAMSGGNGLFGTDLTGQDLMTGLGSLYGMYQNNRTYGGVANNLQNMYGQNSPYAEALRKQLMRRDAAAGRRSQYGPREVELQAKLAEGYGRNAPALLQAQGQMNRNRMAMTTNLLNMLGKSGAIPAAGRYLKDIFGGGGDTGMGGGEASMPSLSYDFGSMPNSNSFDMGFGMDQTPYNFGDGGNYFSGFGG